MDVCERSLKLAARDLVRALGGVEAAAAVIGKSKSQVHRCSSVNDDSNFLTLRDAVLLEELAGDPAATRALARAAGGVFVRLPEPELADDETLALRVAALAEDLGAVSHEVCDALRDDGAVDTREAERIAGKIDALVEGAMEMRSLVRALNSPVREVA